MSKYIDLNHPIAPTEYIDALKKRDISTAAGLKPWSLNETLELMDKNDISASVLSISEPGVYLSGKDTSLQFAKELSHQMNEICARIISDNPQRFGAFAALPLPDTGASLKELEYAFDVLKLDGVSLFSNYDGYYLGDPKFDALFSELNRKHAVVFIHPSAPPVNAKSHLNLPDGMLEAYFDITRTVFSLMVNGVTKKYPDIRFILGNAGGATPYMAARVGITAAMSADLPGVINTVVDIMNFMYSLSAKGKEKMPETIKYFVRLKSNVLPDGPDFYLKKFYYDTALSASPYAFLSLQTLIDSSKIVFGTGGSLKTQEIIPSTIQGLNEYAGFNEKDRAAIGRDNALNLIPRLKA